jgi:hypothetical protein
MVRYIKDGAYMIKVESPPNEVDTDGNSTTVPKSEEELSLALERKEAFELEECAKDIDFTSVDFILQNLQLATPDFSDDKTFMLTGRKDLVDIICSQICFYCYCALFALETKAIPISILIIGDGFIGSNLITTLSARGCGSMLRVFTRSDTRAAEWNAKDIKSDCSIMQLLGGQRPDIIIPCVENASFSSITKQLMDQNIVTESSFIITPTFGFQRKKLLHSLKCSNIFRTFVEPQRIVRKYRTSTVARRMQMMSLLAPSGQEFSAIEEVEEQATDLISGKLKSRDSKLLKSVLWGGDFDDAPNTARSGVGGFGASFLMRTAMENIQEGVETGADTTTDGGSLELLPLTVSEEGAALLRERQKRVMSLVQLLENYYFIHGMVHHEARMTAVSCVFGFHEIPASVAAQEDAHSVVSGSRVTTPAEGRPTVVSVAPPDTVAGDTDLHDANSENNDQSLDSRNRLPVMHHHHKHHTYTHNLMRRSKTAPRIKLALEQAIDEVHAAGICDYQTEFRRGLTDADLLEMIHHYPPNHQFNLDQLSFLANHAAAVTPSSLLRSNVNTPGSAKPAHNIPKHDRHKPFMYDEEAVGRLFHEEDEDYSDRVGPGFDLMRQMDAVACTPRNGPSRGTARRQLELDVSKADALQEEDISALVKLLEVAKEQSAASATTKPPVSGMNRGGGGGAGGAGEESDNSMGKRMFRKHSLYNTDMHKTTTDIGGEDFALEDDCTDFTQIMSAKASRRQQRAGGN